MIPIKDKISIELVKKITPEKMTALRSFWNQDKKNVKLETEKIDKLLPNIPTDDITDLNEIIYAGAKIVQEKICFPPRNLNRTTNLDEK